MPSKYLTTGQAADILSVTPDTVLKWIRTGLLPARRTPGGHHRIDRRDLDVMTKATDKPQSRGVSRLLRPVEYCWEFYGGGSLPEECRGCVVFVTRAKRCYEVARLAPQSDHHKAFCKTTCEECEYYRMVHKQQTNVLVVTDDETLAAALMSDAESADFNLEIVDCEYVCSSKITDFRPDFAVVDCSLGRRTSGDIGRHLVEDPRIPSVRVVFAGNENGFPEECGREVFARIKRPFGIREIREIIDGLDDDVNEEDRNQAD